MMPVRGWFNGHMQCRPGTGTTSLVPAAAAYRYLHFWLWAGLERGEA